jgi:hypothetical protein
MTGGGPPPAARHVDLSYGANMMKVSFVNPLSFEGEKNIFELARVRNGLAPGTNRITPLQKVSQII